MAQWSGPARARETWEIDDVVAQLRTDLAHAVPQSEEPKVVHYTEGGPWHGIEGLPYNREWDAEVSGFVGCP